jgi:hypothetical protein
MRVINEVKEDRQFHTMVTIDPRELDEEEERGGGSRTDRQPPNTQKRRGASP